MKKTAPPEKDNPAVKKGYNEKNPGAPQGAFPPADENQPKEKAKSNAADKKTKEDQE